MVKPKTRKLSIYEDEETGSYFIRAMQRTGDPKGFKLKNDKFGRSMSNRVSDAEFGKAVREIFENCD